MRLLPVRRSDAGWSLMALSLSLAIFARFVTYCPLCGRGRPRCWPVAGAMGAGCLSLNTKQHNKMRPPRYTRRLGLTDVPAARHSCLTQKRRGVGGIRFPPSRRKRLVRDFYISAEEWRARGSHPASKAYEASQSTGSPAACRIYLNQTHETWIGSRFHRNRISRVSLRYDRRRRYQLLPALTHPEV